MKKIEEKGAFDSSKSNKMKLQLIFPAWCLTFGKFKGVAKAASSFPPLNLCYLAAIAKKEGWEVEIVDAEVEELDLDEIVEKVRDYKADLVGITSTTPFYYNATELASAIKKTMDVPLIIGGVHASILREEAFHESFDYLFVGEAESTFQEFLHSFAEGKGGKDVKGIMRRVDGKVEFYGEANKVTNLDDNPWPARELLKIDKYFVGTLKGRLNYTSLFMSRGCPFKCVYCASDLYGTKVRKRKLERVMEELEHVVNDLGLKHIYFLDDTLTLDRKFILEVCEEIKKRNIVFTFEGGTRANLWDEELVKVLKECGLIRISFGLETADPEVRKIIKKEVDMKHYLEANKLNHKLGIETINSVMLGLPGETRESIENTVDFLCKAREIEHATYSIAIPYPGTELLRMAKANQHGLKLIDTDFANYQRYGSAVMEINGIKPEELVELQKKGLRRIYSCWWRFIPMLRRHGIKALLPFGFDYLKGLIGIKEKV